MDISTQPNFILIDVLYQFKKRCLVAFYNPSIYVARGPIRIPFESRHESQVPLGGSLPGAHLPTPKTTDAGFPKPYKNNLSHFPYLF